MSLTVNSNPEEVTTIENVKKTIVDILNINAEKWPEDKEIDVKINMMVVPESITLTIKKK